MDKKERLIMFIIISFLIISIGITYYKTIIKKDFEVVNIDPDFINQDPQ